ncbi:PREDICTED: cornulin-like [Merops nubicus]|uniref:cornulin-like n=1 Tax=Merops nubicus TaxID=57421 RepID=UPI0004F0A0CC|nr:PREDICTED: cornulin-like [Merops nubicus]
MAQLQENINGIVAAFYMCTRGDGNCSPLSREELRQLIEQEFGDVMENPQDPKSVKKVLCFLDDNSNCRVDFSELLSLVFQVAKACYKPLQQHQELEEGQELRAQEKADGDLLLGLHEGEKVSHNQHAPEQGVNNQVQDTETQDTDNHQTQEGETPAQDQDNRQDEGTEAPEGDPERAEILDTASPEQYRNKAEEIETSEQDPKTHQAEETEAPGQGSDYPQSPEMESVEQDLTCASETEGRDPNKTQVCEAPWQDPNPDETQNLLPPQQGVSPRWDPEPWGMQQDQTFHQLPGSKEQELSRAQAPSCPAQQQDARQQIQPALEQQLQQSLYQWPPQ